jgi:uncharacterized protein involved in exopolysaccharide biosynthesis
MGESMKPQGDGEKTRSRTPRDLLGVVFRWWRFAALAFVVTLAGTLVATLSAPQHYESELKILVKLGRVDPVLSSEGGASPRSSPDVSTEELNSEVELIKSQDLLEGVVVNVGLDQTDPGKTGIWAFLAEELAEELEPLIGRHAAVPGSRTSLAVEDLEGRLRVEAINRTRLISVRYRAGDPALAARVLQTLADLYLEKHLSVHRIPGTLDFLAQQVEHYRTQLSTLESSVAMFPVEQEAFSPSVEKDSALERLSQFQVLEQETTAAIAEASRRISSLESDLASTPSRITTQLRVSDNPYLLQQLRSTLVNLELKHTELQSRFGPDYRPLQEVESQIAQAREAIAVAEKTPTREETTDRDPTRTLIEGDLVKVRSDLASMRARKGETQESIRKYQAMVEGLSQKEIAYQRLVRSVKEAEDIYLVYTRRLEEARIAEEMDRRRILNVAVVEGPTVPSMPAGPRPALILLLGAVLASALSVVVTFILDRLNASFHTPDDVEDILNVPVLASVPVRRA